MENLDDSLIVSLSLGRMFLRCLFPWTRIVNLLNHSPVLVRVSCKRPEARWVASKALPNTRRWMMPQTPQQISHSSNESQWQEELEAQGIWSTQETRVISAMENYLEQSIDVKVEIKAFELLMDPEDSEVCLR